VTIIHRRRSRALRALGLSLVLAFGASALSAQTPDKVRTWRFYVSAFGAFVGQAEFPNAFNDLAGRLWVMIDESRGWGLIKDKADPGYGFTIGATAGPDFGGTGGGIRMRGYLELTYIPGIRFPDQDEFDWRYHADPAGGPWIDEVVTFTQTGRKSHYLGLNFGAVVLPFRAIPAGVDLFGGLWSCHKEFVSGTVAYYDGRTSIEPVKSLQGGDYEGRGKFVKNQIGFVLGAGLKIYPLPFVSIDAKYTLNLVTSRKESTDFYYVESGETVMRSVAGFGNVTSIGLTVYF